MPSESEEWIDKIFEALKPLLGLRKLAIRVIITARAQVIINTVQK